MVKAFLTIMITCSITHHQKFLNGKDVDWDMARELDDAASYYGWVKYITHATLQSNNIFSIISGFLAAHSLYRSS